MIKTFTCQGQNHFLTMLQTLYTDPKIFLLFYANFEVRGNLKPEMLQYMIHTYLRSLKFFVQDQSLGKYIFYIYLLLL